MVDKGLPPSSRLRDGHDDVGLLLRSASQASTGQETPPFSGLLVAQRRRQVMRWGTLALAAGTVLALGIGAVERSSAPDIRAEVVTKSLSSEARGPADTQPATSQPNAVLSADPPVSSGPTPQDQLAPVAHSPPNTRVSPVLVSPPAQAAREDCPVLLRSGLYAEARRCFNELSRGSGVDAEMALLEKARLEMRAFKDRTAALSTLQSYRTRFPGGILMTEAIALESEVKRSATDQLRALEPSP